MFFTVFKSGCSTIISLSSQTWSGEHLRSGRDFYRRPDWPLCQLRLKSKRLYSSDRSQLMFTVSQQRGRSGLQLSVLRLNKANSRAAKLLLWWLRGGFEHSDTDTYFPPGGETETRLQSSKNTSHESRKRSENSNFSAFPLSTGKTSFRRKENSLFSSFMSREWLLESRCKRINSGYLS